MKGCSSQKTTLLVSILHQMLGLKANKAINPNGGDQNEMGHHHYR